LRSKHRPGRARHLFCRSVVSRNDTLQKKDCVSSKEQRNDSQSTDPPTALQASRELARQVAQLAHDRHCSDIVILELADRSPVAKHFVVCTGTSSQQIRSVAGQIAEMGKNNGFKLFGRAGI